MPDMNEVRRRLPLIDYRALEIDERAGTALLAHAGMRVHLGGIGKGYAVDKRRRDPAARGISRLHDSVGRRSLRGRPEGRPAVAPRHPGSARSGGAIFAAMDLSDSTFSTSGDYERFFMKDGRRYHHILDPAIRRAGAGCRSVTIVAPNATLADGLSTGVFMLGPEEGMALVKRLPGVEAVIVTSTNEVLVTPRLKDRLALTAAPTDAP